MAINVEITALPVGTDTYRRDAAAVFARRGEGLLPPLYVCRRDADPYRGSGNKFL